MIDSLRASWHFIRDAPAGERFIRYHRHRRAHRRHAWVRPLRLGAGIVVVIAGIILMPAPGPGLLVVAVGAALLAGESASVARMLDAAERRIRKRFARAADS